MSCFDFTIERMLNIKEKNNINYEEWKAKSKKELKNKLKENLNKRANVLEEQVNKSRRETFKLISNLNAGDNILPIKSPGFIIPENILIRGFDTMSNKIDLWKGVNVHDCKEEPQKYTDYFRKGNNWLDRQKGKWFGQYIFYPILLEIKGYCNNVLIKSEITFKYNNET